MAILPSIGQGASIAITINAVDKFSKTFKAASLGIHGIEMAMKAAAIAIAATAGTLTAIGVASLKSAASFETAFTGVRKTVELTEKGFAELEDRFKEISKTTPIAFVELAHIGELAGQLGVEGVDNIEKFTKTIADISVTTNLSAEQAATDFARFANIMNMPIEQVDRLGSVIVELGNNLATTEAEIVEMGMRIAGAGKALDFTEGQVMAWSAALSSVGVEAQMGGTAISKMMINMSSMVATGSEDLAKFAEVAGMTSEEFTQAFQTDASAALQTFFNGLGKIKEEGGNVLQVLENLDIKEVRLRDSVLRLSSSYETLNQSLGLQDEAWQSNTALVDEAQKRYDTFDSRVKILKNTFSIFIAGIGDEFMPVMKDLVKVLTKEVIPALEPLIPILGKFFKEAIEALTPHLEGMTNRFVELVEVLLKDIIPTVIDVARLIGGFLVERIKMLWNMIKPLLPSLMKLAKLIFDAGKQILESLLPPIMKLIPVLLDLAKIIIENAVAVIMNLLPSIQSLIPIIVEFFESLKPLIPKLFELIEKLAEAAIEIFKELIPAMSILIPVIMDVIDIVIDLLPTIVDITTTLIRLANSIISGAAPAIEILKNVFLAIIQPIKTVIGWITDLLDLIGRFLGKSSELGRKADRVTKDVSTPTTYTSPITSTNIPTYKTPPTIKIPPTIYLNDFIMTPKGQIIKPNAQDTIIGTKNPGAIGGITIIIEGDVTGTDPEQMAEAFGRELKRAIRI